MQSPSHFFAILCTPSMYGLAIELPLTLELKRKKCSRLCGIVKFSPTINSIYTPFPLGLCTDIVSFSYVRRISSRNLLHFFCLRVSVQGADRCRSHNRILFFRQTPHFLPDWDFVKYAKRSLVMRYCLDRAWNVVVSLRQGDRFGNYLSTYRAALTS